MKRLALLVLTALLSACGADTPKGPAPAAVDSAQAAAPRSNTSAQATPTLGTGVIAPAPPIAAAETASAIDRPASPGAGDKAEGDKAKDAKPSAPAAISAAIRPGSADVSVAFGADGKGVVIKVWGVDGLTVTKGATPTTLAAVKSGESTKIAVQFTAPTSECNLAVSVSGTFGGREQTKVQSFTVNPGAPKPSLPAGTSTTDKDGRAVKVMKAK